MRSAIILTLFLSIIQLSPALAQSSESSNRLYVGNKDKSTCCGKKPGAVYNSNTDNTVIKPVNVKALLKGSEPPKTGYKKVQTFSFGESYDKDKNALKMQEISKQNQINERQNALKNAGVRQAANQERQELMQQRLEEYKSRTPKYQKEAKEQEPVKERDTRKVKYVGPKTDNSGTPKKLFLTDH